MKSYRHLIELLDVESSYRKHNLGNTIYDFIIESSPQTVVEFGVLHGYSTICIGLALKSLSGNRKLISYDLWEDYPYNHGSIESIRGLLKKYELESIVDLRKGDVYEWAENPEEFDLLHLDISNSGNRIMRVYNSLLPRLQRGSCILFEGGTAERDAAGWTGGLKHDPITALKETLGYEVIDNRFPGLSVIKGFN